MPCSYMRREQIVVRLPYPLHQRVEAHVKETMDKYAELILKYDEKQDAGLITETDKEALRNEKIKLEESLINNIRR